MTFLPVSLLVFVYLPSLVTRACLRLRLYLQDNMSRGIMHVSSELDINKVKSFTPLFSNREDRRKRVARNRSPRKRLN
ncbi:hypothetical protein F5B18DRAFT_381212 [Nemania serpens]|nr:hypothetical protein F5B18DRAFT_381212 [Nemania serpens]